MALWCMAFAEDGILVLDQQATDFLPILPPILHYETLNYVLKVVVGFGAMVKG